MKERLRIVTNGLLKENPSLRLVLGTCPTLAVTTVATNGLGTVSYTHLDVYKRQGLANQRFQVCQHGLFIFRKKVVNALHQFLFVYHVISSLHFAFCI